MEFIEIGNLDMKFNEVQIAIDSSENYAEIVEVYRTNKNGPGFMTVTSIKAIDPQSDEKQNINENSRRFEL